MIAGNLLSILSGRSWPRTGCFSYNQKAVNVWRLNAIEQQKTVSILSSFLSAGSTRENILRSAGIDQLASFARASVEITMSKFTIKKTYQVKIYAIRYN